jgi:ACS family hexuronate transporter-like MFS transporter
MFPKDAVGSVVGFGTMAGSISGMLVAKAVGYILQGTGSYVPVFLMAGLAYLVAFGFIQALAPRLKPAEI